MNLIFVVKGRRFENIGYDKNKKPIFKEVKFLSDYTMADFKYITLPKILSSKQLAWRTKDGKEYYIKPKDAIGKKTSRRS